jgi:glucose/mannose-6-phosphate isomerase
VPSSSPESVSAAASLRADEIARVDRSHQMEDVLAMPAHLHDALWRVETAGLEGYRGSKRLEGCEALLVCGMGGSAVGADLAASALGHRLTRPLATVRSYELPSWATPDSLVLCSSYSGNTEETLACYDAAGALGAMRVVATTGGALADAARSDHVPVIPLPAGLQPRAAVAYMVVSTLEVASFAGVAPGLRTEIDRAADELSELKREWGPDSDPDSLAKQIAERAHDTCLCVYGAGPTAIAAYRWKCQINENAKVPAFAAELPEADHNEIVGWEEAPEIGNFFGLFLEDTDQHPRTRRRIDLTEKLIAPKASGTLKVESRGQSPLARLLSLVLLGDMVSIYLAVLRGLDPTPVKVIDQLKTELASTDIS